MKKILRLSLPVVLAMTLTAAASAPQTQEKVDYGKILGTWTLDMDFNGNPFSMTLEMKMVEDKLGGVISDQMGMLNNVPLSQVQFDGQTLKSEIKVAMPPDNVERVIKLEAKLAEGKLQGTLLVADFGMAMPFTGTKK
jgi:hypothetical protein